MKLAMFKNPVDYANWCNAQADGIERNALAQARDALANAVPGRDDIDWLAGNVRYLTRKVNKYRRNAAKALEM